MLIKTQCPNCGALLDVDIDQPVFFCMHCGTRIDYAANNTNDFQNSSRITEDRDIVIQEQNTYIYPNLIVTYTTAEKFLTLLVSFNGQSFPLTDGATREFYLPMGKTVVNFKLRKSWNRNIFIGRDNLPVNVHVVVGKSVKIYIEQPQQAVDEWNAYTYQLEQSHIVAADREREDKKAAKAMRKEEKQRAKELKRLKKQ